MSYQYAASYPSPKDAASPLSRIVTILGGLASREYGRYRHRGLIKTIRGRVFSISTALILLWIWLLHWGERSAISNHVKACDWDTWENWPKNAQPHRVAFVADPQLVDPHTYPGRPWPLSSLTIAFTDLYLKRSYKQLHRLLNPDTVFFLGDLFDGGREWSTYAPAFHASEDQWKRYGETYWLQEYDRFGNIFFAPDQVSGGRPVTKAKRVIASLPGNHDLGFGNGIQKPVKERFRAYFGESDRVDVLGNHTFVSLDTVSLSAMGQADADDSIWNGTLNFLENAKEIKSKTVQRALDMDGTSRLYKYHHEVLQTEQVDEKHSLAKMSQYSKSPELPTIVLSHVPLYRDSGTPCGPWRERYPPSAPNLEHDEANAIRVAAGYQYQNVLTRDISKLIAEKVSNVGYAFSGDDHDYCELVHRSYSSAGSGIREITVKSISWAMGVRKPGFVIVSLWNPVDGEGQTVWDTAHGQKIGDPTLQTHLCLLPDQLAIFIRYGICAVFSLVVLVIQAIVEAKNGGGLTKDGDSDPILPIQESKPDWSTKRNDDGPRSRARNGSLSATSLSEGTANGMLSARSLNVRTRSVSPLPVSLSDHHPSGYTLPTYSGPLIERAGYYGSQEIEVVGNETDEWGNPRMRMKPKKPLRRFGEIFGRRLGTVGGVVLVWYWWLLRS